MNTENEKAQSAMKNEPKVIYLNCYDEAEMDESYLPINNDFDSLDTEFVLWSAEHPCLGGHIKYLHHSEVDALQSRISELQAQNKKYEEALEYIIKLKSLRMRAVHATVVRIATEALNHKPE